jgi:predicted RNase H-like HicB family nuclease
MAAKRRRYKVEIIPEEDGSGYYAIVPSLPGCFSQGKTIEETKKNVREAIALHIKSLKKAGDPVPSEPLDSFQTVIEVAA